MISIIYSIPRPRVTDAIEQDLQNRIRISYERKQTIFLTHYVLKFCSILIAYYRGFLDIQNPATFLGYYYIFMGFYCLFFIFLPTVIFSFRQRFMYIRNYALQILVVADLVIFLIAALDLGMLYPRPLLKHYLCEYLMYLVACGRSLYQDYQRYRTTNDLHEYQIGTRNRIFHLPTNIKGA